MGDLNAGKNWFDRADKFQFSACFLLSQGEGLLFATGKPGIVLRAFATECYLKALLCLHDIDPPQTHDLVALFGKLPSETRNRIKRIWWRESKSDFQKMRKNAPDGIDIPTDLISALRQSARAFIEWRYEEDETIGFSVARFPDLVRAEVLKIASTWRPLPSHPFTVLDALEPERS